MGGRIGDGLMALALTVAGVLEALLGPGTTDERLVGALALPALTLPLALRRDEPVAPLATIAVALPLQAALGGLLAEQGAVPLAALVLALYSAGRHIASTRDLVVAGFAMAAVAATKIAFDPAIEGAGAFWMVVYTPVPLLVGRWLRGQELLQRELREKGEELERQRERNARHAAEAERMRIATDLQSAVTGGLVAIREQTGELSSRLAARDGAAARDLAAAIAARAREALADVRRILGVLRREAPAPLVPAGSAPAAPAAEVPADSAPAGEEFPGVAPPRGRVPAALGRLAARLDLGLVPLVAIGGAIELALVAPAGQRMVAAFTALPVAAPLYWRRRSPVAVVAAVLAAIAVQSIVVDPDRFPVSSIVAVVCAAYALGATAALRPAVAGLVIAVAGSAAHAAVFHPGAVVAAVLGGAAVPWTFGRTVRARRLLTAEIRDKAARLEEAREQEAQAAVVAERARVARELHDAVAHSLSVIAIQAAGACGIAERDPERAGRSAELIESVGRDALTELGRLVAPPDGDAPAGAPTLAAVGALAQRVRQAGLPVELDVEGVPRALPAGVDLAAFRIVQEALANVSKHARAGRAWVVVRYAPGAVELEIADDGRGRNGARPRSGGGHGLVGMRERAALYGGTLDAGDRPGGGFVVRARLPI